jgi:hypothetical protein
MAVLPRLPRRLNHPHEGGVSTVHRNGKDSTVWISHEAKNLISTFWPNFFRSRVVEHLDRPPTCDHAIIRANYETAAKSLGTCEISRRRP